MARLPGLRSDIGIGAIMAKTGNRRISDGGVDAVFAGYPAALRRKLQKLRSLILETARASDGVGPLLETLKWGQPSYLPAETGSGTTVRIDQVKDEPGRYAMYFHCQTNLVETFRAIYPIELTYGANRSILFDLDKTIDEAALKHCIALALTYHQRKATTKRSASSRVRRKTS
jgi:hypothetical protein